MIDRRLPPALSQFSAQSLTSPALGDYTAPLVTPSGGSVLEQQNPTVEYPFPNQRPHSTNGKTALGVFLGRPRS